MSMNFTKTLISICAAACLLMTGLPAQAVELPAGGMVSGVVKDASGAPIFGASVFVPGTTTGTTTAADGSYSLKLNSKDKQLIFSFVGYQSQTVDIAPGQTTLNITLKDDTFQVGEVVVTALGLTREAKSLSYNVQQLSGDATLKVSDASFVNNLAGKVAGVQINTSSSGVGSSTRVVMRGVKSIENNNNALYVIDGIPMYNSSRNQVKDKFEGAGQTGDALSTINPEDIESLSVLSGPAAAALYGAAAANGAIMVTTKKGQADKTELTISNSTQLSSPFVMPKFQNTYDATEAGFYGSWGEKLATPSSYDPKDFFQRGLNTTSNISLSTGSEKSQTYISLGNVLANGIIHNNDFTRYNLNARNTTKFLKDKMTLDLNFTTALITEQNMISQGLYMNPLVPLYLFPPGENFTKVQFWERINSERNIPVQYWPYGDNGLTMQNPYWITERNLFNTARNRSSANISLKYDVADWLSIIARGKVDVTNERSKKRFYASTIDLFASKYGFFSLKNINARQSYGEVLASFNKQIQDFDFGLNLGTSIDDFNGEESWEEGNLAKTANVFTITGIDRNATNFKHGNTGNRRQTQSVYGSLSVGYKNMVFLDASARNDWPSTLARAKQSSFFYPSIGISGVVTDIFDIKSDVLSFLKARFSYAEVGYAPNAFLTIPIRPIEADGMPSSSTMMFNDKLEPELTKSLEAGINASLFNGSLKIDLTLYKSSTYNQYFNIALSPSNPSNLGYSSMVINAGQVDNRGIEANVRYTKGWNNLKWSSYLTYSLNQNEIISLLEGQTYPDGKPINDSDFAERGGTGSYKMTLVKGGSITDIYVNTLVTDANGAIYVNPVNQTVLEEQDPKKKFMYAGNSAPKFNMGWGNDLNYKNFSFGFLFNGRFGGIVVSNTQAMMDAFGVSAASADAREKGGAIVNGKRIPAQAYYQTVGGGDNGGVASMYCYSATNIRLGELSLGYTFDIAKLTKNTLKNVNVSFIGRNLLMIYNTAPFDPESVASTGTYFQGIDYFMQPSLRTLGFSVKLKF